MSNVEDWLQAVDESCADSVFSQEASKARKKRKRTDMDDVPDLTPRPRRTAKRHIEPPSSADSSSCRSDSQASGKRSRPNSPTKGTAFLASLLNPIVNGDFGDDLWQSIEEPVQTLLADLQKYSVGIQTIDQNVRSAIEMLRSNEPLLRQSSTYYDESSEEARYGPCLKLADAQELVMSSRELSRTDSSEASWNSQLHASIFNAARQASRSEISESSKVLNITNARLHSRYHQRDPLSIFKYSKSVDFGIVLQQSQAIEEAYEGLAPFEDGTRTWNHTGYHTMLKTPLAISVETKRDCESFTEARNQLKVWAAAHLDRLEELIEAAQCSDATPCSLPLLLVQGSLWHFHLARRTRERLSNGRIKKNTILHSSIILGHTSTIAGVYQIFQCLRRLLIWVQEEFRPWFERHCLPTST